MQCYSRIRIAACPVISHLLPTACLGFSTPSSPQLFTHYPIKPKSPKFVRLNSTSYNPSTVLPREEHDYNWIDGIERLEKYKLGGYHPVMIGDILHRRHHIVDKLGYGGYSTIWLARDTHSEKYVAVKIGTADLPSRETGILPALSSPSEHPGSQSIPLTLDEFELHGPNGIHQCYTMAPARCNLQEVSFSRLFPLEVARALAGSLTQAIAHTHSQGYAHGDVHLRNVLVKLPLSFDRLSIEQLYEEYGEPETVNITERNGKPLPQNIAPKAVLPLYLGKDAEEFSLSDVRVILGDFAKHLH